jgi:hypothetical protein
VLLQLGPCHESPRLLLVVFVGEKRGASEIGSGKHRIKLLDKIHLKRGVKVAA